MAEVRYKTVGTSVTTPTAMTRRKEILVPMVLTDYTLLYHYGDLDKTPVRNATFLATLSNGEKRTGVLDDTGKAQLCGVPKGPVSVAYQHDAPDSDDADIVAARDKIRSALDAIVAQTKLDMAEEWKEWNEAGWLKRQYLETINTAQGGAVGAWHWLSGTVDTIWQLGVLLYKFDKEKREINQLFFTGQWAELDKKLASYRAKGVQVLGEASEVKELLNLIFHDQKTRELIASFAGQWWAAIPPDEQRELVASGGMQIIIDVVIGVLLAAFTAGAAGAAYGSAKWAASAGRLGARLTKLLDKLKESFELLAKALRVRKRRTIDLKKRANGAREIETTWKPEPKAAVGPPGEEFAMVNGKKVLPKAYGELYHGTDKATLGYADSTPLEKVAADIYKKGLPARGQNIDLAQHAAGAEDRAFRGTTTMLQSPDAQAGAVLWADEGGLVVKLKNVKGYDVNELLEGRVKKPDGTFGGNAVHGEQEIAVPGAIKPEQVEEVFRVVKTPSGRLKHDGIPR